MIEREAALATTSTLPGGRYRELVIDVLRLPAGAGRRETRAKDGGDVVYLLAWLRSRVMVVALPGVTAVMLTLGGCGQSDPKTLLLGQWKEDMRSEKWDRIRSLFPNLPPPRERTIHFFPDGTAVDKTVYDDPDRGRTHTFTWSLSRDGKTLKTEDASLRNVGGRDVSVDTARIVTLTKKELRIDEPSAANGLFQRVE